MLERRYIVKFKPAEEGGYVVTVPSLPGLVTYGETLEEAKEMAKDAIICHIEGLQKSGLEVPTEKFIKNATYTDQIAVAV